MVYGPNFSVHLALKVAGASERQTVPEGSMTAEDASTYRRGREVSTHRQLVSDLIS